MYKSASMYRDLHNHVSFEWLLIRLRRQNGLESDTYTEYRISSFQPELSIFSIVLHSVRGTRPCIPLPSNYFLRVDVKMNPKISLLILLFLFVSTVSTFNVTCKELDETSE